MPRVCLGYAQGIPRVCPGDIKNQRKSMIIKEIQRKSKKLEENQRKPKKTQRKSNKPGFRV